MTCSNKQNIVWPVVCSQHLPVDGYMCQTVPATYGQTCVLSIQNNHYSLISSPATSNIIISLFSYKVSTDCHMTYHITILYRSQTSGWVLSVMPVVCLIPVKEWETNHRNGMKLARHHRLCGMYSLPVLPSQRAMDTKQQQHSPARHQTSSNIKKNKNKSSFLTANAHGHTGKPIRVISTFCATLKCCCQQMHPTTFDFHTKLNITYSKLVCTSTGCPPNAGTALSIKGCDLTKFNVWSDNVFESSVHVCKWTNKNTFTNVRLQKIANAAYAHTVSRKQFYDCSLDANLCRMRFRNVGISYRKPVRVNGSLFFVWPCKASNDVWHLVCADCSSTQTVPAQWWQMCTLEQITERKLTKKY